MSIVRGNVRSKSMNKEHKDTLLGYRWATEDAYNKEHIIEDRLELIGDKSILGQMQRELADQVLEQVHEYLTIKYEEMEEAFEEAEFIKEQEHE